MILSIKKHQISFLSLLILLVFSFASCEQEDGLVDTENFSDEAISQLQSSAVGKKHCLEFVFPLSIQFMDSSIVEVTDYDNLHETIENYFIENDIERSKENKPTLVFPIEVVSQEGEIIQVDSREGLKDLKSECPREGKCEKGRKGKGHKCFTLVFPISIVIDGASQTFDTKESLKEAIKDYKETAGEDAERPELVFPVSIEYDDETIVEVSSKEELSELKEACKE